MSTDTTSGDGQQSGGADPAAELLERLRSAPAVEVLTELLSTMLSTAQIKLGRRDARLFIDLCSQTVQYARPYLPEELTSQVERALGQLRLAQVQAESEVAKQGEPEPHDLEQTPAPPSSDRGCAGRTQQ